MDLKSILCAAVLSCSVLPFAWSQVTETDATLNETVLTITKKGMFSIDLETTLYKPDGDGPFPLVVVNHGKSLGSTKFQSRYRPASAARYFLQRGYVVVVPMRQGFANSSGNYIGAGCNIESNGLVQAKDVKAVLDYMVAQPWIDKQNILIAGQSHGGWTTLAFGTYNYPGVKALINFAGGLRQETCTAWESGLARAAGSFGKETQTPSLWFYGDNDSYFNTFTYRGMFEKYSAAGANARLIEFGKFGNDAHGMFGSRAGEAIWQPEVSKLLATVGMPYQTVAAYRKFGSNKLTPIPPKTEFADLQDLTKVPHVKDTGRTGYQAYLTKEIPRAFAIAPSGAWGWANGGDDPLKRALDHCNKYRKEALDCKLYSVDDLVVWVGD